MPSSIKAVISLTKPKHLVLISLLWHQIGINCEDMYIRPVLMMIFWAAIVSGCTNPSKNVPVNGTFRDYRVWSEEGEDLVSCMLQFHRGGPETKAIALRSPGKVLLDKRQLQEDSAAVTGVYYEMYVPVDSFTGNHRIDYWDEKGKLFSDEFSFNRFSVADLPERVKRAPFVIQLDDFPETETRIHLVMVDTAFMTNDINELLYAVNGEIRVTEPMLRQVKNGPISLEIFREQEKIVKGGRISVRYGVKREFELIE
jgi:hypothetical protein